MRTILITLASLCALAGAGIATGAPASPAPEGTWLGTLQAGELSLRIAFHLRRGPDGALSATMDSLSQGARGIPVDKVTYAAPVVRLELSKLGARFEGKLSGDQLVGTFTQGQALPLSLERVASLEPPRRPQEPKRPLPYREEEVTVTVPERYEPATSAKQVVLAGTLTLPPGKGPFPAVLFITGSGAQDRDETIFDHRPFFVLSDALTRAGIATLRFDDRGTGKSGGTLKDLTTHDNARDALRELTFLQGRPEIDRRALGIIGHSEGGLIAPMVATQSSLPTFLVLLAGTGMTGREILKAQTAAMLRVAGRDEAAIQRASKNNDKIWSIVLRESDPARAEAAVRSALADDPEALKEALPSLAKVTPWLRTFLVLDPLPYLRRVRIPVLALNGALDLQVEPTNLRLIEQALRAAGNRDVTAAVLPGLNHLFQHARRGSPSEYGEIEETIAPELIAKVRDYVLARARGK